MEIQKVIRILALLLVVAAFAINVATRLMFPEASHSGNLPIAVILVLCLNNIWRDALRSEKQQKNPNE